VPFADENPFSARRLRPGAIGFRFPAGESLATLLERLCAYGWRGQIIGPHGSGKSTLLAALAAELSRAGRRTAGVELHDRQRRLPRSLDLARLAPGTLVMIDGYEQLARWNRWRLKRTCRRRGLGLLVTAHRDVGLPTLLATATSVALAEDIVRELLGDQGFSLDTEQIAAPWDRHGGNVREVLFDLYDLYEQRRR
jgi:hypothetical protein